MSAKHQIDFDTESQFFTVITPTWNRASLLERCFESLCRQRRRDLEWIVVDDGSEDHTRQVISGIAERAPFRVVYAHQENSGKHVAINRGVEMARGKMTLILDSDDVLLESALCDIASAWNGLDPSLRSVYAGVVGHSVDRSGALIGSRFPREAFLSNHALALFHSGKIRGDKLLTHRTDLLRRFPFPVFPGERFLTEGIVWDQIRAGWKYLFVERPLQAVDYQSDGLSAKSRHLRASNPIGASAYYLQLSRIAPSRRVRWRALLNFGRFSVHARRSVREAYLASSAFLFTLLTWPIARLLAGVDRLASSGRR